MEKRDLSEKQSIRNQYLFYRDSLTKDERLQKSRIICGKVSELPEFVQADIILFYMDYRSEVITSMLAEELLNTQIKRIFCPKVIGLDIQFFEIHCMEDVVSGYQGIKEPEEKPGNCFNSVLLSKNKCFMLMPGSVFDKERNRLGYGKGFYDKFLHKYPEISTAALSYDCQIAKKLPVQEHDIKPDKIITETSIIL